MADPLDGPSTVRRPNVVVILADDMGWGDLGCYGATKIRTPNMDSVADQGRPPHELPLGLVRLLAEPLLPAHRSLRMAWTSEARRPRRPLPADSRTDRPTLASVLHDDGYATAAIGKWHLGLGWQWHDRIPSRPSGPRPS